jgi:hypothetical protein
MPKSSMKITVLTNLRQNLPRPKPHDFDQPSSKSRPSRTFHKILSVNQRNCRVIAISTLRSLVNLPRHHCHVTDRYGRSPEHCGYITLTKSTKFPFRLRSDCRDCVTRLAHIYISNLVIRVFRYPEEKGVSIEICTKNTLEIEVTYHIRQVCEIEQLVEARGSSWHAPASRWHRPLRSLGIARHRMASLGTSRHPEGTSRRRGGHGRRGAWRRV